MGIRVLLKALIAVIPTAVAPMNLAGVAQIGPGALRRHRD
jgi:hypothetical protein